MQGAIQVLGFFN